MTILRTVTMSILLRAVLALTLLAGLYLVALILVLMGPGLAAIGIAALTFGHGSGWSVPGYLEYLLLLVATLTLEGAILRGVLTGRPADSRTRIPVPPGSELWPMVTELARRIGTAPPKSLYLYIDTADATDVNAEVRENARCMGLLRGTRSMDIGLPLLAALSPDELQAVLGHELGHYNRNDTRLIPLTYRGHITIQATFIQLLQISESRRPFLLQLFTAVSIRLFGRYARLYLRISTAVARRQELRADAQAAQAVEQTLRQRADRAGQQHPTQQLTDVEAAAAQVTAQALLLAHAVPQAWADFLSRCTGLMRQDQCSAGELFIAFQHMITGSGYQQELARLQVTALNRPAKRFDTHPSLDERIRRLGLGATGSISPASRSPLLDGLQPHLVPLAQDIYDTVTRSAATARNIPGAGTQRRPADVVSIELDDGISPFWGAIRVIGPILAVLSIVGFVGWVLSTAHSAVSPDSPTNTECAYLPNGAVIPVYPCLPYGQAPAGTALSQPPQPAQAASVPAPQSSDILGLPSFSVPAYAYSIVIVQSGDTLSSIACRWHTTVADIQRLNHLGKSTLIYPGEGLTMPAADLSGQPSNPPTGPARNC